MSFKKMQYNWELFSGTNNIQKQYSGCVKAPCQTRYKGNYLIPTIREVYIQKKAKFI